MSHFKWAMPLRVTSDHFSTLFSFFKIHFFVSVHSQFHTYQYIVIVRRGKSTRMA